MGLKKRLRKIVAKIYERKVSGDIITQEGLIVTIEDVHDISEQTAKKYINDIERRGLLEKTSEMTYKVKPEEEIPEDLRPEGGE